MKKVIGLIFAALLIVAGLSVQTNAQYRQRHNINAREAQQQRRIYQGVRSGSLNSRETYRLERQQANLRRTEARYRSSGGGLSERERRNLQYRESRTSRSIYRQKHDNQTRRMPYAQPYPRRRL